MHNFRTWYHKRMYVYTYTYTGVLTVTDKYQSWPMDLCKAPTDRRGRRTKHHKVQHAQDWALGFTRP